MATLFRRMPELALTSTPVVRQPTVRHPVLSELEFAARPSVVAGSHARDLPPPAVFDPFDEDWYGPANPRELDPRLQRVIAAAARGWVVERYG